MSEDTIVLLMATAKLILVFPNVSMVDLIISQWSVIKSGAITISCKRWPRLWGHQTFSVLLNWVWAWRNTSSYMGDSYNVALAKSICMDSLCSCRNISDGQSLIIFDARHDVLTQQWSLWWGSCGLLSMSRPLRATLMELGQWFISVYMFLRHSPVEWLWFVTSTSHR